MTTTLNSEKGRPWSGASDMKAVLARAYGGPEALTLEDVDRPRPQASQVVVEVHAAATNPSYWHRMEGKVPMLRQAYGDQAEGRLWEPFSIRHPAHNRLGVCDAMIWVGLHAPVGR